MRTLSLSGFWLLACGGSLACTTPTARTATASARLTSQTNMAKVAALTFKMGFDQGEPDETPAHQVTVKAYLLDRTEVTNADYQECAKAGECGVALSLTAAGLSGRTQPVVGVSWFDADKYCRFVGKRLPTEAEYERVVRGESGRLYPWDGRFDVTRANMRGETDGFKLTAPVGSFPNGQSQEAPVLDLCGNAAEWMNDWYDPNVYTTAEGQDDPQGPSAPSGEKVVRGGSYLDPDHLGRGSARHRLESNAHSTGVGFRCAASVN